MTQTKPQTIEELLIKVEENGAQLWGKDTEPQMPYLAVHEAKQSLIELFEYVIGVRPALDPHDKDWCRLDKLDGAYRIVKEQRQRLAEIMGEDELKTTNN